MIMQKHDNFNDPLFIYLPLYTFIFFFFIFCDLLQCKIYFVNAKEKKIPPCKRKKQTRQWEKREIKEKAICQVTILTAYTH